jgi:hypothetical protein
MRNSKHTTTPARSHPDFEKLKIARKIVSVHLEMSYFVQAQGMRFALSGINRRKTL